MVTHFEATVALLSVVIGLLASLVGAIWKARGWVDNLAATDNRLAVAIEELTKTTQSQHEDNQRRLAALERRRRRIIRLWPRDRRLSPRN